jgi:DNA polymerase III epsilon subunit-like protein
MKLLVIDIETTGLDIETDSIVEIGAALADTDTKEIKLVFDKVVKDKYWNPQLHKKAWIFETSDLTFEQVESAISLDSVFDELQNLITTYDTVAFNLKFDEKFLTRNGFVFNKKKCLMEAVKNYVIFKNDAGRTVKPSVEEIYNHFFVDGNEKYVEKHRGGSDAIDEAKIMLHMIKLKADTSYVRKIDLKTPKNKEKPAFKIKKEYDEVDVDSILPFGKYKGEIFSEVVKKDKNYLQWCLENVSGLKLTENAKNLVITK